LNLDRGLDSDAPKIRQSPPQLETAMAVSHFAAMELNQGVGGKMMAQES
jgi:hypothetical protein